MAYSGYGSGGYGYAGYAYGSYGGTYDSAPYGHGDPNGYGFKSFRTAGYFEGEIQPGQSESFSRQVGSRSYSVYAARDVDGTSYARYSTYNASTGLYHVDTLYARVGPYAAYDYSTYYAHHYDGYTFSEAHSSYDYRPGAGYPSYLASDEYRHYQYSDGSSLDISDYFRSDSTHSAHDPTTTVYQSEAQTLTDPYGYQTYSFGNSSRTLDF